MSLIKRKLGSKAGASMLLALVFLMFCLFIGGSVLAAATANGSRVAHLKNDQQDYLSQRSAMLLMADMLTGKDGKPLSFTVKEQTVSTGTEVTSHTVTYTCTNLPDSPNVLQRLLCECIIANYPSGVSNDHKFYSELKLTSLKTSGALSGEISITEPGTNGKTFTTSYTLTMADANCDLSIEFIPAPGTDEKVLATLFMNGQIGTSTTIDNTGASTTTVITTAITFDTPTVNKGGA